MGLQTIFEAKEILLLASGKNKAEAVAKFIKGEITPSLPASLLQRHEHAVIILDRGAAFQLK